MRYVQNFKHVCPYVFCKYVLLRTKIIYIYYNYIQYLKLLAISYLVCNEVQIYYQTLMIRRSNKNHQMVQFTDTFCVLFRYLIGPVEHDNNKRLILLSVIQLSDGHFNVTNCKSVDSFSTMASQNPFLLFIIFTCLI